MRPGGRRGLGVDGAMIFATIVAASVLLLPLSPLPDGASGDTRLNNNVTDFSDRGRDNRVLVINTLKVLVYLTEKSVK